MSLRHAIRRGGGVIASSSARQVARGGGGPPMPPFARNKPVDYQVNAYFHAVLYLLQDDSRVSFTALFDSVGSNVCCRAWVTHTARFSTQHLCLSLPDVWRCLGCAFFPLLNEAYGTCQVLACFFVRATPPFTFLSLLVLQCAPLCAQLLSSSRAAERYSYIRRTYEYLLFGPL